MVSLKSKAQDKHSCKTTTQQMNNKWKNISVEQIKENPFTIMQNDWTAIVSQKEGIVNAMPASWGEMGVLWSMPIITVFVPTTRYTHELMENNEYFVLEVFDKNYREALNLLSSRSGRDFDKVTKAGLTSSFTAKHNTPYINEGRLIIECKKIYSHTFDITQIPDSVYDAYYKDNKIGMHTMYIGQIINIWTTDK